MKNFDWLGFENGEFEVKCVTEEDMKDFLVQCEEHRFMWLSGDKPTERNYFEGEPIYFEGDGSLSYDRESGHHTTVTWVRDIDKDKTSLTWREVINNIQEGEIYECGNKFINCEEGILRIGDKSGCLSLTNKDLFFKKQEVKQVDFQEAQLALEEGKIIKSDLTGFYYKLHNDCLKRSYGDEFAYWEVTDLAYYEITDKWIIIEN